MDGGPDGVDRSERRRRGPVVALAMASFVAAVLVVAVPMIYRASSDNQPMPTLRPSTPIEDARSLSIDFGIVIDPETDWKAVDAHLDAVGANTVNLNAGRVEFTAFDWPEHPEAAAESGTDHLAVAARALNTAADGSSREVNLIMDAYVPVWIKADPSLAGVNENGKRSQYTASASQLLEGEVGDRLVAYVKALGERYDPNHVEVTELFLDDYTFGDDDLALFRRMTGEADWPRNANGSINTVAPVIGSWRSQVLAGLMDRFRAALDGVRNGEGADIGLVMDVRVDWSDPAAGRPLSGHDYSILLKSGVDLQLWVYIGRADKSAGQVQELTAGLAAGGYDMTRFIISAGLWKGDISGDELDRISPAELAAVVAGAATNGITAVNVTPYSLMTPGHWAALRSVWA